MPEKPIKKEIFKPTPMLLIVALILFLSSCVYDPVYNAIISNKSDQEVLLEIWYNKTAMAPSHDGQYFIIAAEGASEVEGGKVISTDTINWILKFKLGPNEHYTLEDGPGNKPNFEAIKSIHVFDKDTILLNSKEKMFDFFKNNKENTYEFEIK